MVAITSSVTGSRRVTSDVAGWTCEASCFANNPQPDLQDGLGELEIKAETLRYIVCASNDLLADYAGRGGLGRARRLGTRATQHIARRGRFTAQHRQAGSDRGGGSTLVAAKFRDFPEIISYRTLAGAARWRDGRCCFCGGTAFGVGSRRLGGELAAMPPGKMRESCR